MEIREQIRILCEHKMREINTAGEALTKACLQAWPKAPVPRNQVRYLTHNIGIKYNDQGVAEHMQTRGMAPPAPVVFFVRVKAKTPRRNIRYTEHKKNKYEWRASGATALGPAFSSPRDAARVLARLDAFHAWLIARLDGVAAAVAHTRAQQEPWAAKLNARLAILELSGHNIHEGKLQAIPSWPAVCQDFLRNNRKIDLIKWIRETVGVGLADAKMLAERAYSAYGVHGSAIFQYANYSPSFEV